MLRRRIALAVLFSAIAALAATGCNPSAKQTEQRPGAAPTGRQFRPPYYVFSPDVPPDIVTQDVGAIGFQPFVDNLAWDSFIALNWPVPDPITQRGVPDRQNVIGGFLSSGEGGKKSLPIGPTVWETYKDTDDIFLNPPVKPSSFDTPESIPPPCIGPASGNSAAARRTLTQIAKVSDVLKEFQEAFTGFPLIDQNGEYVWYEVKVNQAYYDYVVNNSFFNSANQTGKVISFPSSSNTTRDVPAIKIKAAWKIMGGSGSRQPDDPTKFYTTSAFVYNPETGQCAAKQVGLVGLHIVMKTALLPQWNWATFEHVDNAPDQQGGPVPGKKYNFFSSTCAGCPFNKPPTKPNMPTQVVRLIQVSSIAPNSVYQDALTSLRPDNVWQYYMLVDSQWSGTRTPIGVPTQPKYLANASLETYLQGAVDDPKAPHGCINCHGTFAATKDLDFQLFKAYPRSTSLIKDILKAHGQAPAPR